MTEIYKAFFKTNEYSIPLARLYGIPVATLIHLIVQQYWTEPFVKDFINLPAKALPLNTFDEAIRLKIITPFDSEHYILDTHKIETDLTPVKKDIIPFIFDNEEFKSLMKRWNENVVKARLGRPRSTAELLGIFTNKSVEESIAALKIAVEHSFTTLNFDGTTYRQRNTPGDTEATKGNAKGIRDDGGTRDSSTGAKTDAATISLSKRIKSLGGETGQLKI